MICMKIDQFFLVGCGSVLDLRDRFVIGPDIGPHPSAVGSAFADQVALIVVVKDEVGVGCGLSCALAQVVVGVGAFKDAAYRDLFQVAVVVVRESPVSISIARGVAGCIERYGLDADLGQAV